METYRAFINQPSKLQPLYKLNGKHCIVQDTGERSLRVWFTEGDVHSMEVLRECVSRIHLSSAG